MIARSFVAAILAAAAGMAQNAQPSAEISQHDEPAVFMARVNLVLVPVVVRDRQGKAAGDLRKEDFRLLDQGKPQEITKFSVERPGERGGAKTLAAKTGEEAAQPAPAAMPERFVAYLFDDVHLDFADLAATRDAARRHLSSLLPTDRAAIYTTSGRTTLEFTDDREQLADTLNRIMPRLSGPGSGVSCPKISYYQAIGIDRNDPDAMAAAMLEMPQCMPGMSGDAAVNLIQGEARRMLHEGEYQSRVTLLAIEDIIRRMAAAPGQRTIVLVSPGFMAREQLTEENQLLERAIRAKVVINSLDARGLYVPGFVDASQQTIRAEVMTLKMRFQREEASAQADILAEMAVGTGGTFFENSNDLEAGFDRLAGAPEAYYVLGFSPQNLRLDGKFHKIKVTVKEPPGLSLSARRGYYAPTRLESAEETAKREIEEALFSREEMQDLPAQLHTQFFKSGDGQATLTVMTHLDTKQIPFRKADGRNCDTLTIVNGVFDRNGNLVSAITKTIELRLFDRTMERLVERGMTVRTNFDVKPGGYAVRLVVRDAEGQLMTAGNGSVEIP